MRKVMAISSKPLSPEEANKKFQQLYSRFMERDVFKYSHLSDPESAYLKLTGYQSLITVVSQNWKVLKDPFLGKADQDSELHLLPALKKVAETLRLDPRSIFSANQTGDDMNKQHQALRVVLRQVQ